MTWGIIVSLVGLIFGAIRTYPSLKKFFVKDGPRPRIEIELIPFSALSSPMGSSPRNEFTMENFGGKDYRVIDGNNAVNVFQLTWKVQLNIRNHSDVVAYYPEVKMLSDSIFVEMDAMPVKPISHSTEISLEASCSTWEEKRGTERTDGKSFPEQFKNIKLLIKYKNSDGKVYYTLFDNTQQKKNSFPTAKQVKEMRMMA